MRDAAARCAIMAAPSGHGMLKKLAAASIHLFFFAIVVVIGSYWAVRIFTPAPTAAPPPLPPPPLRDPDQAAAARMFGKVEVAQVAVAANIQALGAFAAGKDSSAVLVVDGKPPRVFLVGQEVVPGTTLNSIQADVIVLDSPGGPQEVRLPPRPTVAVSGAVPAPNFTRSGNTLTAPSSGTAPAPAPRPAITPPPPGTAPGQAPTGQPTNPVSSPPQTQ
jgi:general secretion pathway protein C